MVMEIEYQNTEQQYFAIIVYTTIGKLSAKLQLKCTHLQIEFNHRIIQHTHFHSDFPSISPGPTARVAGILLAQVVSTRHFAQVVSTQRSQDTPQTISLFLSG